jgi:16S rRNA (guanine527-N7)-methyltransferase
MSPSLPVVPSSETIQRAMAEFQLTITDQQVQQIQQYMGMLLKWNDAVNLTAIRDPLEMLYRHFCESMYAAVVVSLDNGRLADVGSGGGFPGLPLKILRPDLEVFLVESNVKKATFLAEVVRELGLTGARVLVSRYEELGEELTPLDFVCSRAVGEFLPFLHWAGSEVIATQNVVLWIGGRDLEEVRRVPGWNWREPVQIPQSLRRFLLVGARVVPSDSKETEAIA